MNNRRHGGTFIRFVIFITVAVFIAGGGMMVLLYHGSPSGPGKNVVIRRGTTLGQVARMLDQDGVIKYPTLFKVMLRLTGGQSRMRAGEFRFHVDMSLMDAMWALYFSEGITHPVTVPEGWNIRQIAKALADAKLVDEKKFLDLALTKAGAEKYKLNTPTLEGFLYPDTYKFSVVDGEEKILDTMVQQFFAKFTPEHRERAKQMGFSLEEIVTLASIVEKETGVTSERELVSSVFHNRLKKKMRLQSDPTTIYGIANFDGNLTREHLRTNTPYNTYTIPALPPGPIASPGLPSLLAAINPAQSDFYYFVADKKGGHIFSNTYTQHARHVNSYQRGQASIAEPEVKNNDTNKKPKRRR